MSQAEGAVSSKGGSVLVMFRKMEACVAGAVWTRGEYWETRSAGSRWG